MKKILLIISALVFMSCAVGKKDSLQSPDGRYTFEITSAEGALPSYNVVWNGQKIVANSVLGFVLTNGDTIPKGYEIKEFVKASKDENWKPVYGEQESYRDNYNSLVAKMQNSEGKSFSIEVRAYNEGVAFRYQFAENDDIDINSELTEFAIDDESTAWVTLRTQTQFFKKKVSELGTQDYERPFLAQLPSKSFVAIGEAALVDFSRMKLIKSEGISKGVKASLAQNVGNRPSVRLVGDNKTSPWRYIMAGTNAPEILQNNGLILNLNEPCKVDDVSWIKPGKVLREMSLSTSGSFATIDFAKKYNIDYIMYDGGWYGNPNILPSDATTVTPLESHSTGSLDIDKVVEYGKKNGVKLLLYVDRRELERKDEKLFSLYESWGVAGIKYGFVRTGSQYWTAWLHNSVAKAVKNHIMINIHDDYRPTGLTRTYPHMMTVEGIRGDEEAATNGEVLTTLFTRMIVGGGDQTNCYFDDRVESTQGSRSSQLARYILIYSPWQHIFWYDHPKGVKVNNGSKKSIAEIKEIDFYKNTPTVWDETKVVDGYPGEYALMARRSGANWYVAGLTAENPHKFMVDFDFLNENTTYKATIYTDSVDKDGKPKVVITEKEIKKGDKMDMDVNKMNGFAMILNK